MRDEYYFLEDGRVCQYSGDILGGRQYDTFNADTYTIQMLIFRRNNPLSNIGIKRIGNATPRDWLLFKQRLWGKRYFEQTGKTYEIN